MTMSVVPEPMGGGGGNPSGFNNSRFDNRMPMTGGGGGNPFLPQFPGGVNMPSATAPNIFPANGPSAPMSSGANPINQGLLGLWGPNSWENTVKGLMQGGFGEGVAQDLASFLQQGAGYNPQVLQALIAQLQPQVNRGEADIMEQFSAEGNRFGSPAGIGLGDFLSQVNLNESQMATNLYEQSVQNFMSVLLAGKKQPQPSGLGGLLGGAGSLLSSIPDIGSMLGIGGASGGVAGLDAATMAGGDSAATSALMSALGAMAL